MAVSLQGCVRLPLLLVLMLFRLLGTNSTHAGIDENAPLQQRARCLCLADVNCKAIARVRLRSPTAPVATVSLQRRENAEQKNLNVASLPLRRQIVWS